MASFRHFQLQPLSGLDREPCSRVAKARSSSTVNLIQLELISNWPGSFIP
jgi:hypothetical protein